VISSSLAIRSELRWKMHHNNSPSATLWFIQPYQDRSICRHHLTHTQLIAHRTIDSAIVLESSTTDREIPGGLEKSLIILGAKRSSSQTRRTSKAPANVSQLSVRSLERLPSAHMSFLRMNSTIKSMFQPTSRPLMLRLITIWFESISNDSYL